MPGNRKVEYDPELVSEWAAKYESGMSQYDIAAHEAAKGKHTSWESIKRELAKIGVKFRSVAEQQELAVKKRKEYFRKLKDSLANE